MNILIRFALPALLAGGAPLTGTAFAQDKMPVAPMSATASAAPIVYESAFADYRSDKDAQPVAWKEANARVAQPHDEHAGHDMAAMKHGHHAQPAPAPEAKKKDPHQGHQHKE